MIHFRALMLLVVTAWPLAAHAANLDAAESAILQADGPRALIALDAATDASLTVEQRAQKLCMRRLLDASQSVTDDVTTTNPLARDVSSAFRTYWRDSVREPARREDFEGQLQRTLRTLANLGESASEQEISDALSDRLQASGYYSNFGRTGPLLDLMLWTGQDERHFRVRLPESVQRTTVFVMSGFSSEGWARYLTCGSLGTGGWTNDSGLWIIASQYPDLVGEDFRVNFLAHESQHFADRRFGDLPGWRLEFRAKLVELAYANTSRARTLRYFISDQSDDEAIPHSFANKRVVNALLQRLHLDSPEALYRVPFSRLQHAARAELVADTVLLRRR